VARSKLSLVLVRDPGGSICDAMDEGFFVHAFVTAGVTHHAADFNGAATRHAISGEVTSMLGHGALDEFLIAAIFEAVREALDQTTPLFDLAQEDRPAAIAGKVTSLKAGLDFP